MLLAPAPLGAGQVIREQGGQQQSLAKRSMVSCQAVDSSWELFYLHSLSLANTSRATT